MIEIYNGEDLTVVIPAHNCECYIREALQSIELQTIRPGQIIIIENASSDGTRECLEGYAETSDLPLKIVYTDCPGVSNARNIGFSLAETELIAMLDADDLYEPAFLELALKAYNVIPDLVLFFGNRKPLKNGSVMDEPFLENTRLNDISFDEVSADILKISEGLFSHLVYGNFISCSGAVVRRSAAYAAGLFSIFLIASEDRHFFSKLALQGESAYTLVPTHLYRAHDLSRTGSSSWLDIQKNSLLCLKSLRLESTGWRLMKHERDALNKAYDRARKDFFYIASEHGIRKFINSRLWARQSGIRVLDNPWFWIKALKNSYLNRL
ncbi:glycosyltransferase family A protein [Marinobacter sp. AN1]|uniref:glycosyltransferase family A protein n=1 Tax=Marinobacter sp. AN1 TaxID=2886046 RepID=UPI0022301A8A|nr:glycosyltransferase family 2 protein [Marinobacter sp. AN1]UZD66512.1 glycosyltransferase family 2 protein [Marinobacter sp. AN1]